MNEMELTAALLEVGDEPSAEIVAEGRSRLTAVTNGQANPVEGRKSTGRRSAVRQIGFGIAAPVLATGLIVGIAVLPRLTGTPVSAKSVLRATADSAAQTPAAPPGTYFYSLTITGGQTLVPGKGYAVESQKRNEYWRSSSGRGRVYEGRQTLATRAVTAADQAAWRADGSPTTWVIPQTPANAFDVLSGTTLYGRPGTERLGWWGPSGAEEIGNLGNQYPTPALLDSLPTTPKRLRAWLTNAATQACRRAAKNPPGLQRFDLPGMIANTVRQEVIDLLTTLPAPPEVRAAAFRILAETPGALLKGPAKDPLGRDGIALALPPQHIPAHAAIPGQEAWPQQVLIVAPSRGTILAVEDVALTDNPAGLQRTGQIMNFTAYLDLRWVNTLPSQAAHSPNLNGPGRFNSDFTDLAFGPGPC